MRSVDFCQDGVFVRVSTKNETDGAVLSLEDPKDSLRTDFPCHIDDLLAAARGLTYQVGNAGGHVLITLDGNEICMRFALTDVASRSCSISKSQFEQSLIELKSEGDA